MSPTRRMRIGIDFDGTLADSIGAAAAYLEDLDGIVLEPHERTWPPGRARLGAERFNAMIEDARFFERLDFVPGAEPVMRDLLSRAEVFLVTARTEKQTRPVRRWLEERELALSGVASTSYEQKTEAVRRFGLDVFFDDMLAHTRELSRETNAELALLAAPWNSLRPTEGELPEGELRVHASWEAFHRWLCERFAEELEADER